MAEMKLACLYPTKVGKQLQFSRVRGTYETRNGKERNQLGHALVNVALAVPKFVDLFSVVLLYQVVFLY